MPTNQSENTNQYRCETCGRYFNQKSELQEHAVQCAASQQSGGTDKPVAEKGREQTEDREWISTP